MSYVGDLYTKVMEQLKSEPILDATNIAVSINENGVVVLAGKVRTYTEKYIAEETVEKVEGVRGIANELEIDLASSHKRNDADIAEAAINALRWSVFVPDDRIKVAVDNGTITLSGEVDYYFQKERAEKAIRDIVGITNIINNINVKSSITPAEVKEKIISQFERNARIDANNIEVEVNGSEVTLRGTVSNLTEKKEAVEVAWSIPGIIQVHDSLTIKA